MEEVLKEIGLSDKEAKVYLACLTLGKDSVYDIAIQAGLKRPTVYLVLNDLLEKGLVSIEQTTKAKLYSAVHPKKLLSDIEVKRRKLEASLVDLESIYNRRSEKPKVRTFEGIKNVEVLYDEISDFAKSKKNEVLSFGTIEFIESVHPAQFKYWKKSIHRHQSHIREILNGDDANKAYSVEMEENNPNHQIRFLSDINAPFGNDNLIFGNKLAIFSSQNEFFVIVIESESIVQSFKSFFELAWQSAKNPNPSI